MDDHFQLMKPISIYIFKTMSIRGRYWGVRCGVILRSEISAFSNTNVDILSRKTSARVKVYCSLGRVTKQQLTIPLMNFKAPSARASATCLDGAVVSSPITPHARLFARLKIVPTYGGQRKNRKKIVKLMRYIDRTLHIPSPPTQAAKSSDPQLTPLL